MSKPLIPPPWKHQQEVREKAKDLGYYALFWEMGVGKSRGIIDILRDKINTRQRLLRTLVFGPPITLSNFANEIRMFSKIPEQDIIVLQGSGTKRLKTFLEHAFPLDPITNQPSRAPAIFITNYEALLMERLYYEMKRWEPEALIFDESHKLKNPTAKRSKLAEKLANPGTGPKPLTYLLSGSPVLNSPLDLFQQFLILDGGETFGKNFFIFRARYFQDRNAKWKGQAHYFPDWQIRPGAVEEINGLIFSHSMRVTKKECMDLPEEVAVTIPCSMTPEQADNYKELKEDFVTFVASKSKEVTAPLAITKALRLMQIASGFLPVPSFTEGDEEATPAKHIYEDTAKEEALEELLRELTPHSKVIVWAVWKVNYERIKAICEKIGLEYVEVHGGVSSAAKRDEAVKRFQTEDGVRVYLGHPGSGGIGINLVVAPYSIFYSRTFSLEHWLQARARNHRGGQNSKVTHYDLVCEGTIDSEVVVKLAEKQGMSEALLTEQKNLSLDEIVLAVQTSKP